jgi:hypothetical protein
MDMPRSKSARAKPPAKHKGPAHPEGWTAEKQALLEESIKRNEAALRRLAKL